MIPTQTLRERMREALYNYFHHDDPRLESAIDAAIEASGEPVLIKTADTLEPTFTLRAQDPAAVATLKRWLQAARTQGCNWDVLMAEGECLEAFCAWPARKWPD